MGRIGKSEDRSYHSPMRLVLASASPRRAELLRAAGFTFDVCAVDVDERVITGETPTEYVRRLAIAKVDRFLSLQGVQDEGPPEGGHVRQKGREAVVLAADTAVVIDGTILGKPRDDDAARMMLRRLSGR